MAMSALNGNGTLGNSECAASNSKVAVRVNDDKYSNYYSYSPHYYCIVLIIGIINFIIWFAKKYYLNDKRLVSICMEIAN